jgi:hypothetical protein
MASDVRELTADEIGVVAGAAVLEVGLGPVTFQWNLDQGHWAVWIGKELVARG